MGRYSRSPSSDRRKSRDKRRRDYKERKRSRSRDYSPQRKVGSAIIEEFLSKKMRRRTSPIHSPNRKSYASDSTNYEKKSESKQQNKHQLVDGDDKNIEQIMASLGLPVSFDTTKGKEVPDNANNFGVKIKSNRQYRQYMNRKGGFNRLLDPEKTQPKM